MAILCVRHTVRNTIQIGDDLVHLTFAFVLHSKRVVGVELVSLGLLLFLLFFSRTSFFIFHFGTTNDEPQPHCPLPGTLTMKFGIKFVRS